MELPAELQEEFRNDLHHFEEERRVPYLSSIERLAKKEGREEGRQEGREEGRQEGREEGARAELFVLIQAHLKERFGTPGSRLMAKVRTIHDLSRLRLMIAEAIQGRIFSGISRFALMVAPENKTC